MLPCSLQLHMPDGACVKMSERHWWLTAFVPGVFFRPAELCLQASVCFPNREMLEAFHRGLCRENYPAELMGVQNLCMTISFHHVRPQRYNLLTRFWRRLSQCMNRFFCRLFVWVTRPFACAEDRILFLYYYLPRCFRRLMRLRRFHRRCHRKNGCCPPKCCRKCNKRGRSRGCGVGKGERP